MFDELDVLLPPELVGIVLCFEGRIYHDFVRDFIESVYVRAYRRCFRRFTFKGCLAKTRTLHYYAVICQALRAANPHEIKKRKTTRHRMPHKDAIVKYKLHKNFVHMLDVHTLQKTRLFGSFFNRVYM
jgi:hypothetical protein